MYHELAGVKNGQPETLRDAVDPCFNIRDQDFTFKIISEPKNHTSNNPSPRSAQF